MSTHPFIQTLDRAARARTRTATVRLALISSLGPAAALGGAVWAVLQPYRITLLHPHGQGFWWLFVEPPLLVVLAGLLFHAIVARPLVDDLKEHDAAAG
jgi:hypothetical protein